jgi:GNAT superfamily N-acetyltransferase
MLKIIDYRFHHKQNFYDLNKAWIEKSFVLEDVDKIVLNDPQKFILDGGGQILMAEYENNIVGTVALKKIALGVYELTKMAVDENYRGLKIGRQLGLSIIERAKTIGASKIELFSNTKGSAPAIQLYRKLGFTEIPLGEKGYARADIRMELNLV